MMCGRGPSSGTVRSQLVGIETGSRTSDDALRTLLKSSTWSMVISIVKVGALEDGVVSGAVVAGGRW